jgi:hypothetical protein
VSRTAERQVSFADWELMRQGLRLEPLLQAISDFLDNQKDMIEQVRCDLARGLKKAETGRSGLSSTVGFDGAVGGAAVVTIFLGRPLGRLTATVDAGIGRGVVRPACTVVGSSVVRRPDEPLLGPSWPRTRLRPAWHHPPTGGSWPSGSQSLGTAGHPPAGFRSRG